MGILLALLLSGLGLWGGSSWAQPITASPASPDPVGQALVDRYMAHLVDIGQDPIRQAVWIQTNNTQTDFDQTGNKVVGSVHGTVPLPAASLTKVATALAVLHRFGPHHRFATQFSTNGSQIRGTLEGDLVVQGSGDPFFVWEDAIAVGNLLAQHGIHRISGDLLIVGPFRMNFFSDPWKAGQWLQQGLNARQWPSEAAAQFALLPPGTPRPELEIAGSIQVVTTPPEHLQPLIRHESLPLAELLKRMNRFSNNIMAQMLAETVGGAEVVAQVARDLTGIPPQEIQLINGSGLGEDNRLSARATVALFLALQRLLSEEGLSITDCFVVVGQENTGVLEYYLLPDKLITKSGTLDAVSGLAGVLPTRQQGMLWFAILNGGPNPLLFRTEQGLFLNQWLQQWDPVKELPPALIPHPDWDRLIPFTTWIG